MDVQCFLSSDSGMYKAKAELCLDCRFQAAGHVLQQCCLNGHEATIVVYSAAEMREIVPVYWPAHESEMNVKRFYTVKADHLKMCHNRMKCSSPHHYLEARILNIWRENSVMINTRPSPVRLLTASVDTAKYIYIHVRSLVFSFM